MPIHKGVKYSRDFAFSCTTQCMPMLLSSKGRYIWSERGLKISVDGDELIVESESDIELNDDGTVLKENFISPISPSATIQSTTKKVRIQFNGTFTAGVAPTEKVCLHNASVDLGYKPYIPNIEVNLSTGTLNGIGTAQDEITETELKKVVGILDLGTPNWYYETSTQRFYTGQAIEGAKLPANSNTKANILCSLYQNGTISDIATNNNTICLYTNGSLYIKDTSCPDIPSFLAKISGKPFYYEKATPVITAEGFGEVLFKVQRGGTIETDNNGDLTLDHVVYKPIQ
jgi:hypothetical protein